MLRPGFPRLSHPEVAHAIPSVGFIAQMYRRVRLLVSPTTVGVQLTDQQRTAQAPLDARSVLDLLSTRPPLLDDVSPPENGLCHPSAKRREGTLPNATTPKSSCLRVPQVLVWSALPDERAVGQGIVKLSRIGLTDPQQGRFTTGLEPIILGVGQPSFR